jgi:mRNA interferase RelE/StbE
LAWTIEINRPASADLKNLDRPVARRVVQFLRERIAPAKDPRLQGKALRGEVAGLWRCRVGDYRIVCHIEDKNATILVVAVGHRRQIYRT